MPLKGEFCASNVTRFLLTVIIALVVMVSAAVFMFYSPGRDHPVIKPAVESPAP